MSRGGNIQGVAPLQNHELQSYKKPKIVVQKEKNDIKNPNNNHNYHDENHDEIELYQGNSKKRLNDIQHQNSAHPRISTIDCGGVQLTNAQWHMVPMSIIWYRGCWNVHSKQNKK